MQYVQEESPPPPVVASQRASYVRPIFLEERAESLRAWICFEPKSLTQGVKLLRVIRTIDQGLTEELRYLGRQGKEFLMRRIEKPLTIPTWEIISKALADWLCRRRHIIPPLSN